MVASQYFSLLSCELRITKAKNIAFKSSTNGGNLFVRYYLSAGNNKRIQLNSQEISSNSDLIWNESFSLECLGTEDSIKELKQQSVVLELRWRKTVANYFLGKKSKSKLLGGAEIPWKKVFESPKLEIENWVLMVSEINSRVLEDFKPPSLQVAMKVEAPKMVETLEKNINRRNGKLKKKWVDECGCADSGACSCSDYDIFALAAALEAL